MRTVVVSFETEVRQIVDGNTADAFKVSVVGADGVAHVQELELNDLEAEFELEAGHYTGTVVLVDFGGKGLADALPFDFDVPAEPSLFDAPVPVRVSVKI